jgi:hypothetical protein
MKNSRYLFVIKRLDLSDCDISDDGLSYVVNSDNFSLLENLNLYGNPLVSDIFLQDLAESKYVSKLK